MWYMPAGQEEESQLIDLSASHSSVDSETNGSRRSVHISPREDDTLHIPELVMKVLPDVEFEMPNVIIVGSQGSGKTFLLHRIIHYFLSPNTLFTNEICNVLCEILKTGRFSRWPVKVKFVNQPLACCDLTLSYSTQQDVPFGSDQFVAIRSFLSNLGIGDEVYGEMLEITIRSDSVPNMSFVDMPGLTSRDFLLGNKRFIVDGATGATYLNSLQQLLIDQSTSVIAVEMAGEDVHKSHTIALLKSMESMRPDIFEHTVMVWTKCDLVSSPTMLTKILPILQSSSIDHKKTAVPSPTTTASTTSNMSPMLMSSLASVDHPINELKFSHVIAVVNRSRPLNSHASQLREMQEVRSKNGYAYLHEKSNICEKQFFSFFPEINVGRTCCGLDSLFNHLDKTFTMSMPMLWSKSYSDFKTRLTRYEKDIRLKLAPNPGLYLQQFKKHPDNSKPSTTSLDSSDEWNDLFHDDPFHPNMIMEEFYQHFRIFLVTNLETTYLMSSVSLDFDLNSWPEFSIAHIASYVERIRMFEQFRNMMDVQLQANLEYLQRKLTQRQSEDGLTSFNSFTPFHCLDRFPKICQWLHENLVQVVFPYVQDHVHKKMHHFLNLQWEIHESIGELTKQKMFTLFQAVDHMYTTLTFHYFMSKVVELGYPWHDEGVEPWLMEAKTTVELRSFMNRKYRTMLFEVNTLLLNISADDRCKILLQKSLPIIRKLQQEYFHIFELEEWEETFWRKALEIHQDEIKHAQFLAEYVDCRDALNMDESSNTPRVGGSYKDMNFYAMEEDEEEVEEVGYKRRKAL